MIKHPLESVLLVYLEDKDITKESYDLYLIILKQYITYLKEHEITFATTRDLENYVEGLRRRNYSSRWIYNQISAIKGFYQYLKRNERRLDLPHEYSDDISEPIKNERITHHFRETLSLEQAKHLIASLKENRRYIWHYRDYAIIYLMLISGMRSVEIRRAKKKDLITATSKLELSMILHVNTVS
ncbi:MAG: site-specific integrase [bacterium]